jgi:hypothetical protein
MKYVLRSDEIRNLALEHITGLNMERDPPWVVSIEEHHTTRTLDQNAFLHSVPLKLICDHTGFGKDEMRDYLMMEAFGTKETEIAGRTIVRPIKGSSQLTIKEFSWFLDWIEAWASKTLGLLIPKPDEHIT